MAEQRPLTDLCEQGVGGRYLIIYDDNSYLRFSVGKMVVEGRGIIRFVCVDGAKADVYHPHKRSWEEGVVRLDSFVVSPATKVRDMPDGVAAFDLSISGAAYLLPLGVTDLPLYA